MIHLTRIKLFLNQKKMINLNEPINNWEFLKKGLLLKLQNTLVSNIILLNTTKESNRITMTCHIPYVSLFDVPLKNSFQVEKMKMNKDYDERNLHEEKRKNHWQTHRCCMLEKSFSQKASFNQFLERKKRENLEEKHVNVEVVVKEGCFSFFLSFVWNGKWIVIESERDYGQWGEVYLLRKKKSGNATSAKRRSIVSHELLWSEIFVCSCLLSHPFFIHVTHFSTFLLFW